MQAKDAHGNDLTTGDLNVTMTVSGSATLSSVTDVGDGTYTATIISTTAETVTVTAALGGSNVTDTADVIFVFESETLTFSGLTYMTVQSPDTGKIWLDRNLGASQVCTSSTDSNCYGNYYQWGRDDDGHESSASTSTTLASNITPGVSSPFVLNTFSPHDWTTVDSNGALREDAWADSGANDICPSGYSVPTEAEFTAETNSATAFSSFLKLPVSGYRNRDTGLLTNVGINGAYWSRSSSPSGIYGSYARNLDFNASSGAAFNNNYRANGFSVRCIKD